MNFVSYENSRVVLAQIGDKFRALTGAYVIRGNSTFANLPSVLTESMNGYVYNVTDVFTTDSRFVEGAGKRYPAGTNVAVADLSSYTEVTPEGNENPSTEGWYELSGGKYVASVDTEVDSTKTYYSKTVSIKFDVMGSFVDVAGIEGMFAGAFDSAQAYDSGDVVVYDGGLYQFTADHTADDPWDVSEVSQTTVADLIKNAEPDSLTAEQLNSLLALL